MFRFITLDFGQSFFAIRQHFNKKKDSQKIFFVIVIHYFETRNSIPILVYVISFQ